MPNAGFSWGPNLAEIADAVWTRAVRQLSDVENVKVAISDSVWTRSERKITNLNDTRAAKIDNLDVSVSSRATVAGVWEYPTRGLTESVASRTTQISDDIRAEANTLHPTSSTTYEKVKEFRVYLTGDVRIKWKFNNEASGSRSYTRIYRNGLAISDEYAQDFDDYIAKTYDLPVSEGDYVQIYAKTDDSNYPCNVKNAQLCYSVYEGEIHPPDVTLD